MIIVIDAQLSPHLAPWIKENFNIEAFSLSALSLMNAEDQVIFKKAREMNAIVMTKDEDFAQLLHRYGSPPKIIWITCGNTSNKRIRNLLEKKLSEVLDLLNNSDMVEISD
jgi:predicted nuclease of predicted toxin-antitoxin system